jgi:transcriptional regulator with XRE-family HTH domain
MPRWKLANEIGVSEDTIERWENDKGHPEPDDVDNIERALDIPGIWHKWMRSRYDSYRGRFKDIPVDDNLTEAIVRMKHELSDIVPHLETIERDALSGEFNDLETWRKYKKEASEAMAAIQQTLDRLPGYI